MSSIYVIWFFYLFIFYMLVIVMPMLPFGRAIYIDQNSLMYYQISVMPQNLIPAILLGIRKM